MIWCVNLFVLYLLNSTNESKYFKDVNVSKFHLEFNGFAGFTTVEEARAAADALSKLLNNSDLNNVSLKIRDMVNQRNVDVAYVADNTNLYTYGLQGSNAYIGKLTNVAKKFMKSEEYEIIDWNGTLLKIENQRYYVDVEVFKDIVKWGLNSDSTVEDFISAIPKQD